MARGVNQVELVGVAILALVSQAHGRHLDGDAALALDIHHVERLILHVALRDGAGDLQDPVGQGGLAMVHVRDDAEVANVILPVVLHVGAYST